MSVPPSRPVVPPPSGGDSYKDLADGAALDRVVGGGRVVEIEAVNRKAGLFADSEGAGVPGPLAKCRQ